MNQILGYLGKIGFIVLSVLLIGWTGAHTYDVLHKTNPVAGNEIFAAYGLIVFEGFLIVWLGLFIKSATGVAQQSFALVGIVGGFLLVMIAFFADMMIPANALTAYGGLARWLVIIATALNFALAILYKIVEPEIWATLAESFHVNSVMEKADKKAKEKIEAQSDDVAEEIAEQRKAKAFRQARAQQSGLGNKLPQPTPSAPMLHSFNSDTLPPGAVIKPAPEVPDAMTFHRKDRVNDDANRNGADPNASTPRG